jgi:hypothetical protein
VLHRLIFAFSLMFLAATASYAETLVTVPKDTKISIAMQSNISGVTSATGDAFSAVICEDLAIDQKLVLPAGTIVYGKVVIGQRRHMDSVSYLRLMLVSLHTAAGVDMKLRANFVARGGVVTFKRGDERVQFGSGTVFIPSIPVAAPPGTIVQDAKAISEFEPAMIACSTLLLTKKNKDIDIRIGDVTRIVLLEDLQVNVKEPGNSSLYVECGFEENADIVGAVNILREGLSRLACLANETARQQQEPTEALLVL